MKSVQFTVTFTGEIPDDVKLEKLCLNLELSNVQVVRLGASKPENVPANLFEYETVNVEAI